MIEMVETLIDKEHAYEKNGTVYFRTRSFKDYGKLSHKNIDDLESGHRAEAHALKVTGEDEKEDALDFVLWKPKKEGEPSWESPWGEGRPGWHLECSCMSKKYVGDTVDIHAGGEDLIFPHHENEIAQSEAANGCEFANYWMLLMKIIHSIIYLLLLSTSMTVMAESADSTKLQPKFSLEYTGELQTDFKTTSQVNLLQLRADHGGRFPVEHQ